MSLIDRFVKEHIEYHGLTDDRRRMVVRQLRALEAHAGVPLQDVGDAHLRAFLGAQVADGMSVNTVRKHNHALKPFFRWAWRANLIDADRFMRISEVPDPRGATRRARPRPYKRSEIDRWWTDLDATFPSPTDLTLQRFGTGRSKYRAVWRHAHRLQIQAIAGLALFGALRRDEIFNIGIDDVHPDNDFIVVRHGKGVVGDGSGFREVPYTEEGRQYVGEWLAFRELMKPSLDPDTGRPHTRPWLVLDPRSSPNNWLASAPNNAMRERAFKVLLGKVGPGWEYHRFRHTCATEWLRAGMKLERLSKLLGHHDISETLGYADLVREDVARDARRNEGQFMAAVGRHGTAAGRKRAA